ncbi:MAG: hypothetical protein QXX20_00900 [Candidatus Thermoplasmatota archaeon]
MKKKILGIIMCMLLIGVLPNIAAMTCTPQPDEQPTGIFDRTFIRGFILFPRVSRFGDTMKFFALNLHYRTTNLLGTISGTMRLKRIEIPLEFHGFRGNFYIFGTFKGNLEDFY